VVSEPWKAAIGERVPSWSGGRLGTRPGVGRSKQKCVVLTQNITELRALHNILRELEVHEMRESSARPQLSPTGTFEAF
jgi:hypothetical protein